MENKVFIDIRKETYLDSNLNEKDMKIMVYLCSNPNGYDEIESFPLGAIKNKEDLMKLVSPLTLIQTMRNSISIHDNYDDAYGYLERADFKYFIDDKEYEAIDSLCDGCYSNLLECGLSRRRNMEYYYDEESGKFEKKSTTHEVVCADCGEPYEGPLLDILEK